MYKRIDRKIRNKHMIELLREQLFCNMFATLRSIGEEYEDLSPVEVWLEARFALSTFAKTERPEIYITTLREELEERYGSFIDDEAEIIRNAEEVKRTVFLVMMVMIYMFVSGAESASTNSYRNHCEALANETKDHPLLQRLWQGVRETESKEEQSERRVGVVNYLLNTESTEFEDKEVLQQLIAELVNFTLKCSVDTIEKMIALVALINVKHNGLFNKHIEVLEQGLIDKNEGRITKEYHIEKADFHNPTFGSMYDIHGNNNVHT